MADIAPIVAQNTAEPAQPVQIVVKPATEEQPVVNQDTPGDRTELIPQENWQTSPLFYELANFLGIESREYDGSADQVSVITDWAIQNANSNKVEDIMHTIRQLEDKLQPPPWGEKRVSHIYKFLRMEARYDASRKALGAFTRTGKWD